MSDSYIKLILENDGSVTEYVPKDIYDEQVNLLRKMLADQIKYIYEKLSSAITNEDKLRVVEELKEQANQLMGNGLRKKK